MDCTAPSQVKTSRIHLYLQELRAPFLSASVLPILFGILLVRHGGGLLHPALALYLTLSGIFIHLAGNTLNDYFDFRQGADNQNVTKTPFSGGSGLLADEKLSPKEVLSISVLLMAAALVTGILTIIVSPANPVIVILFGLAGLVLGYIYSAPPFKLCYRGGGEIVIFLACGPLPVSAAYYILKGDLPLSALLASIPIGLITIAILWINQFPDYLSDREAGKKNLVVRVGTGRARWIYPIILLTTALSLREIVQMKIIPGTALWGLIFLLAALPAAFILFRHHDNPLKLVPAMALTIMSHALLAISMIIALI